MHPRRGSGATGKPPNWGVSLRWDSALPFGAGQDAAPLRLIGGRKDAPAGRCFLRVQEDTFPGAGYDLSTQKRVEKRLLCPTFYECSAGVVAYAPNEALPRAPQGLCPDFSELARKNCPRQGLPRPGLRNALRVWIRTFDRPAASLSIFLHSAACGGIAPPALGPGARPCRQKSY